MSTYRTGSYVGRDGKKVYYIHGYSHRAGGYGGICRDTRAATARAVLRDLERGK